MSNMRLDNVLVWTDPHWGHRNIMNFCENTRPFVKNKVRDAKGKLIVTDEDLERMDESLIERWNRRAKGKTILCLGDFTFYRDSDEEKVKKIFDRLDGDKHLIKGNHDHRLTYKLPWSSVSDYKKLEIEGEQFILFHYPISHWHNRIHGAYHLYGHVHGDPDVPGKNTLRMFEPSIDNGVEEPILLSEVVEKLNGRDPKGVAWS